MTGIITRLEDLCVNASKIAISAAANAPGTLIVLSEEGSRILYDIYSLDGFEKWTKAIVADLRFLSLIPGIKGVFDETLKTLVAQRDLYYATLFIGSTAELLKVPSTRKDWKKITLAIGNFFETGKFLQNYKVLSFAKCSEWSERIGAVKVFDVRLDRMFIVNSVFSKPRDICTLSVSTAEAYNYIRYDRSLDSAKILGFVGHIGKVSLIAFGSYYKNIGMSVLDVVTNNASLFKYFIDRHRGRAARFNNP